MANRLAGWSPSCASGAPVCGLVNAPMPTPGAHETEVTPRVWAGKRDASQVPSLLKVRTETLPSELAQARIGPSSCGAQAIALTEGDVRCVSAGAESSQRRDRCLSRPTWDEEVQRTYRSRCGGGVP